MSRANFVQVQLAAAATDIQTTLSIKAPVGGLRLPPADGGRLVLTDSPGRPTAFEVISYTSRTGSGPYTLNGVVRGLEGTVGLAWAVDTFAMQSLTVGELDELLAGKVDKAAGQSLMTDAERTKLDGIQAGAQVNSVTSVAGKTGAVSLAKGDVGLGNVDNTSDANKPISTATQNALNAKAPLASPVFTGTPSVPTPAAGTNTTQIASTAFVQAALAGLVNGAPGALDQLNELAAAMGNDPNFATTMLNALALKAPLDSAALTGNPTAPTPAATDNDTSIATTAFVRAAMALFGLGTASNLVAITADVDTLTDSGTYWLNGASTNKPLAQAGQLVVVAAPNPNTNSQFFYAHMGSTTPRLFFRHKNSGTGLWNPWQELWHTGNLVKQTNVDDLNAGRVVLTETVRRRLTGGFFNTYCDRLILLHPLYVSTLLPYSVVDGKFTATRGTTGSALNQTSAEVVSSSAYNGHATSFYDLGGIPADPWQVVSCTYQGVKYAALIVPYSASGYGSGIFFEGRAVSDDVNQLLCIEYYNRQTATVLNAEVYNSIAPLYVQKTLRIGGERVFHTGNTLGTVSQSGGVPTGAIIERGSNANGEYVRFADGAQICTRRINALTLTNLSVSTSGAGGGFRSGENSVTFAASFVATPVTSVSLTNNAQNVFATCYAPSPNSWSVVFRTTGTAVVITDAFIVELKAEGRWF